jgi:hypothetical protein
MSFEEDLNQSRKGVRFVSDFFSILGRKLEICLEEPSKENRHPPDLVEELEDGFRAFYEVKEDGRSMQTGNIFFEEKGLHLFSMEAKKRGCFALLIIIPYYDPRPLFYYVSNELRQELDTLRQNNRARLVTKDDSSSGWIVPIVEARDMSSNIVQRFLSPEEQMIFSSLFKAQILTIENHIFNRWT